LPRHEADLPAEEAAQEPYARFSEAFEVAGRARGAEAPSRQGAEAARPARAQEVAFRVKGTKAARLRRRREFIEVQQRGRRLFSGELLVLALDSGGPGPRIGITVSSRVGNAVERNRLKRWIREAWRGVAAVCPPADVVVIARPSAKNLGLEGARRALSAARDALLEGRRGG
jgi:ribonuclease P protein component